MELELAGGAILALGILSTLFNLVIIGGVYILIKKLITHYKQ